MVGAIGLGDGNGVAPAAAMGVTHLLSMTYHTPTSGDFRIRGSHATGIWAALGKSGSKNH